MERVIKVHVKHKDGTEQNYTHRTTNENNDIALFITSITDDQPGVPFTFEVTSIGDRFPLEQAKDNG